MHNDGTIKLQQLHIKITMVAHQGHNSGTLKATMVAHQSHTSDIEATMVAHQATG